MNDHAQHHQTPGQSTTAGALYSFGVVLGPTIGALLMSISTVIVAVNAMLVRRFDLTRGALTIDQEALPAHG